MKRRSFLKIGFGSTIGLAMSKSPFTVANAMETEPRFKISLAQWSLNKGLFGKQEPKLDNLDFAKIANSFGIKGLEYVNQFFMDKAKDKSYLAEMKKRAEDFGVQSVLIMCDREGNLGDPDEKARLQAVENHYKWVEAAKYLGCHSIRVNAYSEGSFSEQQILAADGLRRLCEFAADFGLNVIVENHGGNSSNPDWLLGVMNMVNRPNCGTLPDFGNFPDEINKYDAVEKMMPNARGVSAKAGQFDEEGNETRYDFFKMMRIVRDSEYSGFIGIESGSRQFSEMEAIEKTKKLLERVFAHQAKMKLMFNGKDLEGWEIVNGGQWSVQDHVLVGTNGHGWSSNKEIAGSYLRSKKQYKDFQLELQFNINERGNSGILFRSAADKNPAFTGYEMQIADAFGRKPSTKSVGSLYDVIAPQKNMIRQAGQWNYVTIIAKGKKIVVELNGEKIIDTEQDRSLEGYIGLQNHDEKSIIKFKNIRLQEL